MANFIETRGMLAKLLATENLVIEHDASSKTASFDTQNRVLKLPVLKTESEYVYNMFCAHEVGHALQTPELWKNDVEANVPFDFVNVVEDVRIEKYIQTKFPGLRKDFARGYDELNAQDFFALEGQNISEMSFIDRINLHFKLGARAIIPFSTEEQVYVKAVDEADTWQKVLCVSKMIADFVNAKRNEQRENMENNSDGQPGDSDQQSDQTENKPNQSNKGDDDDGGDVDGDNDTPDSANSGSNANENVSKTQQAFDKSMENLAKDKQQYYDDYVYVSVGDVDIEKQITPIQEVRDTVQWPSDNTATLQERERLNEFLRASRGDVNHMVQQFEMKKSAAAYARQQTHKTGVLDTNSLHNYKLNDDIFLRQTITPDGKCHGMVMYLDWSGSMCDISFDTVKQVITLVQFCRKVQIPFDVYLFTTGDRDYDLVNNMELDGTLAHGEAKIIQVMTSTAKKKDMELDMFHLWCASKLVNSYYGTGLPWSPYFGMGGTPLNNALIIVPELIKHFRAKTGAEKVSFVCLTDGESAPTCYYRKTMNPGNDPYIRIGYPYYETMMIRTEKGVFPVQGRDTGDVINWLKTQLTDVFISNIFLGKLSKSAYHLNSYNVNIDEKKFRKNGSYVTTSKSWPMIGVINPTTFSDTTDEIDVTAGESKAKIKSALNKMLKTKQSSKVILTELVAQFA